MLNTETFNHQLAPEILGVLLYLLSKPDNWKVSAAAIKAHFRCSNDRITRILKELQTQGFAKKQAARDERGRVSGWDWIIREAPYSDNQNVAETPDSDFPVLDSDLPDSDLPDQVNQSLQITEKKEITEKKQRAAGPEWLDTSVWKDFKEHRQRLRKPLTQRAEQLALTKLTKLCPNGSSHVAVIEQSILGGWAGLFELKIDSKDSLENWVKNG